MENYKVYKIFPSNIKISLNQTELLASTLKDNKKYFVGANGNLINHDDIIKKYDLPHIFGSFPVEKFILLKKNIYDANFKYNNIENFYYYPNGRWDIKSKNNITIKLPSKNIKDSILKAKILIENNQITENKIIDLRIPNQVILING